MRARARPFVPAVQTLGVILLLIGLVWLLGWRADDGSAKSKEVVAGTAWLVWRSMAAVTIVLFVVLFIRGVVQLRGQDTITFPGRRVAFFVVVSVVVAAVVGITVSIAVTDVIRNRVALPINLVRVRTLAIFIAGLISAAPWLALVWLVHAKCRDIKASAKAAVGAQPTGEQTKSPLYESVTQLLDLWDFLVRCVVSFAMLVAAALLTTGALRVLYLDTFPDKKNDFPSRDVLFYGASFAVFLLLITLPMVASWRSKAAFVVNHVVPIPPKLVLDEDWAGRRSRIETLLKLDVSLLRSPLTAFSALTPVLTSLLAAFLPELASK